MSGADCQGLPSNVRVGVDIAAVADVSQSIDRFGRRYLDRIFTVREQETCATPLGAIEAERLAARFAAKEAVLKALGSPAVGIPWTDIEISRTDHGPMLRLQGVAARQAHGAGLDAWAVSLTHSAGLAAAVVVATSGSHR